MTDHSENFYVFAVGSKYVHIGTYGFELCRLGEATRICSIERAKMFLPMLKEVYDDIRIERGEIRIFEPVAWGNDED